MCGTAHHISDALLEVMEHFIHKEQKITNDTRQHEQLATLKISFIDNLVQNLHARFPDND